jgi:acyl-CoA thioesterase-1
LPEHLKTKPPSYGHLRLLVQALVFAAVLTTASHAAAARTLRVVALGDSLTAGLGLAPGKAFPDRLEAALRAKGWDVKVMNAGVSGDTAADGLARYEWAVSPDADALIIELGANDMRAAPNLGRDYGGQFEAIYTALAKTYGVQLYPFFLDGVAGDPKLNQPDGLHPTAEGVELIVQKILPSVEALMKQVNR